jgi:antitoxin component of RelBE/YafQ-DinJ toxin-antitoxin module
MTSSHRYTRTWEGALPVGIPVDRSTRDLARSVAADLGCSVSQVVTAAVTAYAGAQSLPAPSQSETLDDEQPEQPDGLGAA